MADFLPGPDLRQDLVQLALVRHRLDLLMANLAATLTESGIWDEDGYTTPIQWLREEAKLASGVACQQVSVGLSLSSVPRSVEALERGEIGFGHLALMVDTADFYREGSFDEAAFLVKAREQNVTQFRKTCEHARHAQDPRGFAEEERERHQHRFLKLSPQDGGALWLSGWLDPEGGSQLRSALEPLARKSGVAAIGHRAGATPITGGSGGWAGRPRSRSQSCSVVATTSSGTMAAGGCSGPGAAAGGRFPRCRQPGLHTPTTHRAEPASQHRP